MKVIKSSLDKAAAWKKRYSCKGCSSSLEVQLSDFKLVPDSRDGNAAVFKCPVCRAENWIAVSLLPKHVQNALT